VNGSWLIKFKTVIFSTCCRQWRSQGSQRGHCAPIPVFGFVKYGRNLNQSMRLKLRYFYKKKLEKSSRTGDFAPRFLLSY